jgi:competence ComEA-like helix-hairpin-helix protein
MIFTNKYKVRDSRLTILLAIGCALVFADMTFPDQKPADKLIAAGGVKLCLDQNSRLVAGKCERLTGVGVGPLQIPANLTPLFFKPLPINSAENEMLMTIKGIGPVMAGYIIEYRQQFGPFTKVEDLMALKGVGVKRANYLATVLTFDEAP